MKNDQQPNSNEIPENIHNIFNCIVEELNELKRDLYITSFNILHRDFSIIKFELTTLENQTFNVEYTANSGGYKTVSKLGDSNESKSNDIMMFESFEQMLRKISSGYSNKFSDNLFKGLEKLNDNKVKDDDKETN